MQPNPMTHRPMVTFCYGGGGGGAEQHLSRAEKMTMMEEKKQEKTRLSAENVQELLKSAIWVHCAGAFFCHATTITNAPPSIYLPPPLPPSMCPHQSCHKQKPIYNPLTFTCLRRLSLLLSALLNASFSHALMVAARR